MSITNIIPYLNFDGNADQAIAHYERALGAQIEGVQRFAEVPGMPAPEHARHRIAHACLRIGEARVMLSDVPPGMPFHPEGNVHVSVALDDVADATARFEALAAGGTITMPLQDTFWGARFGMLTDAYGVRWMFNCTK